MRLKHHIKAYFQALMDQVLILLEEVNFFVAQKHTICTSPYISGDAFSSLASHIYCDSKTIICDLKPKSSNHKAVAFTDQNGLIRLLNSENLSKIDAVIYHNTDAAPDDICRLKLHNMNIRLFAVNLIPEYSNETTLPLGIENPSLRRSSRFSIYNCYSSLPKEKNNDFLLAINVNTNAYSRRQCLHECSKLGLVNESFSISDYQDKLSYTRFVISPRGNGVDTHRFWEALYHKCVPVVLSEEYLFSHLHLPVLVLNSWADLSLFTHQRLLDTYDDLWSPHEDYSDMYAYIWYSRILGYSLT